SLQEALGNDELRRRDRAAEDERIRRIIPAHPDLGRRHARLAGGFLDGPIYPRICLGRDWTPATNRPSDDEGRDQPLEENEQDRQADDDRQRTGERVRLQRVVRDREDDEQQKGQQGEQEEDGQQAAAPEGAETSHEASIFDLPMSVASACPSSYSRSIARSAADR